MKIICNIKILSSFNFWYDLQCKTFHLLQNVFLPLSVPRGAPLVNPLPAPLAPLGAPRPLGRNPLPLPLPLKPGMKFLPLYPRDALPFKYVPRPRRAGENDRDFDLNRDLDLDLEDLLSELLWRCDLRPSWPVESLKAVTNSGFDPLTIWTACIRISGSLTPESACTWDSRSSVNSSASDSVLYKMLIHHNNMKF